MALDMSSVGKPIDPIVTEYSWKDVILYALGIGTGFDGLEYVYENKLKVLPSFGITATHHPGFFRQIIMKSGVDQSAMLYAGHELILHNSIPPSGGALTTVGGITDIFDKGPERGALVVSKLETFHSDGQKLYTNIVTLFGRKDGGFGGKDEPKQKVEFPDREPDFEEQAHPSQDQPLLYRLSGDYFPLHADPDYARAHGYEGPIMSGPCTHGYACRALIKHLIPGEPERLVRVRNRFSHYLYPGVPIKTQIWKTGKNTAVFRAMNVETGEKIIDQGFAEWMSRKKMKWRDRVGSIRFEDRVAVVTGAGRGLGRIYALELAKRGAEVVVNDFGGTPDGSGKGSPDPADSVVKEIIDAGGEAIASYDDVATEEGGESIIQAALDRFGRVDILINNAGILRDKTFVKMEPEMWNEVQAVHVNGAYHVTRPALRVMQKNGYGRIVLTTSAAGLYGNFGQTNYGAAKMGLVGLMNSLKLEGAKYGIKVNTVAPIATTRLTEELVPPDLKDRLKPEFIAPLMLYLCTEQCPVSGRVYQAGMGLYNRAAMVSGPGTWVGESEEIPSPEAIARHWEQITSLDEAKEYDNATVGFMDMLTSQPSNQGADDSETSGGESVQSFFDRLPSLFQPEAAAEVEAVFQFAISGPLGGRWYVTVKGKECAVETGDHNSPTTTLMMRDQDFLQMVTGRLTSMQAFSSGKLEIEGDVMKTQLIEKLFQF